MYVSKQRTGSFVYIEAQSIAYRCSSSMPLHSTLQEPSEYVCSIDNHRYTTTAPCPFASEMLVYIVPCRPVAK
jgi:hypothetical protein